MSTPNINILIPIDFSEQSVQAVKYAGILSRSLHAKLNFIFVIEGADNSFAASTSNDESALKTEIMAKFDELMNIEYKSSNQIKTELFIEQGKVYDRILEKAAAVNAKIIIMGCNSAGDYKNRFLGSNALRIMRSCPLPVLTSNHYSQLGKFKQIILPVDLSKDARDKLNRVIELAKLDEEIVIGIVSVVFDADEFLMNRLGQQLVEVKKIIEINNVKHTAEIIKSSLGYESLGEIISDYSKKVDGDVILLITQQEISNTPYFVSSLAQEIINISEVPVMTLAPK